MKLLKLLKRLKIRAGIAIFFIFTGLAIFEFTRTKQLTGVFFFGTLSLIFLGLELGNKNRPVKTVEFTKEPSLSHT